MDMDVLQEQGGELSAPEALTIREAVGLQQDLLRVIGQRTGRVVLGMQAVERIDTSAVQLLLAARTLAREAGGDLTLGAPSETCRATITRLGLAGALLGPIGESARDE